jgi:hypothetical protein
MMEEMGSSDQEREYEKWDRTLDFVGGWICGEKQIR